MEKVVLAYSGGLDTSVILKWLIEKGHQVVCYVADVGQKEDFDAIRRKALSVGAAGVYVEDLKEEFVNDFIFTALRGGAIYEGRYLLGTSLARPVIGKRQIEVAHREKATSVSHGSTGKGNDQVRFDVGIQTLDPSLTIVAPTRENSMAREYQIEYLKEHGVDIPWAAKGPFSIDENMWGRSAEAGVLEDPWTEPPAEAYEWTVDPEQAPSTPAYVEIEYQSGMPIRLDGKDIGPVEMVEYLNELGGRHGVGRIDHIEDRLVGIKSREIYEAPAGLILHTAHRALEAMTLSKQQVRLKKVLAAEYSELIYNGLWFSAHHQDIAAYVASTQRHVTGVVRVKLQRGRAIVVGRKAVHSLYDRGLATYDRGDTYDQSAAVGFINIWGLQTRTQVRTQLLADLPNALRIAMPAEHAEGA